MPMQRRRILQKMYHRLRDHARHFVLRRKICWKTASIVIMKHRLRRRDKIVLKAAAGHLLCRSKEWKLYSQRTHHIKTSSWIDVVYGMSDFEFLASFRITKADFNAVGKTIAWPTTKTATSENEYSTSPELSTLLILRRLASSCRWVDIFYLFKKHPSHMSELFWEGLQRFMNARVNLLCGSLRAGFVASRARTYADVVYRKCNVLENCIGFLDGTVIEIARPLLSGEQLASYNGRKRKNALKFQTVTS